MRVREQPSPEVRTVRFPREQRRAAHPDTVAVDRFLSHRFPAGGPWSLAALGARRSALGSDKGRRPIPRLCPDRAPSAERCLTALAHADDATLDGSGEPGVNPVRYYAYADEDDKGAMLVQDGPAHPEGKWITVTIYQGGYAYSGQGWRSLASGATGWVAHCEFWVHGNGLSAKFTGNLRIKSVPGALLGGGDYLL
jgi:hypothetical protein